jgi:hypothetical protein
LRVVDTVGGVNEAALVVSVAGVIVALIALLRRANFPEVMAFVMALLVTGATVKYGQSTTIASGSVCPGAFGGNISFSDAAWHSFAVMNADRQECQRLVNESSEQLLWVWIIGGVAFVVFIIMSRVDRRDAEKRR